MSKSIIESGTLGTYVSQPIEVEAVQWTGENAGEMTQFFKNRQPENQRNWIRRQAASKGLWEHIAGNADWKDDKAYTAAVFDYIHDTWVGVKTNQFIIYGTKQEFYPCDSDVFTTKYRSRAEAASSDAVQAEPQVEPEPTEPEPRPEPDPNVSTDPNLFAHIVGSRLADFFTEELGVLFGVAMDNAARAAVDAVNKAEWEETSSDDQDVTDVIREALDDATEEASQSALVKQAGKAGKVTD